MLNEFLYSSESASAFKHFSQNKFDYEIVNLDSIL